MNNNYMTQSPNIISLYKLQILDLANQNKNLVAIQDFAFERNKIPANPLNLNMESNDIIQFGNKAFCSRTYNVSEITQLGFSFNTIKNMSKCLFKQVNSLISTKIILRVGQTNDVSYKDVCNCDMKAYLSNLNIVKP